MSKPSVSDSSIATDLNKLIKNIPPQEFTVKPKHWWWPPSRKRAKLMTAIINTEPFRSRTEAQVKKALKNELLYGRPLTNKDSQE